MMKSKFSSGTRTRNLYIPASLTPFQLSRSKLELFMECPRCFYLDRRMGIGRPSGPPFTLNSAVDTLLKKEFDIHRAKGSKHPLLAHYGLDAGPVPHEKLNDWRHNFTGIRSLHEPTNFLFYGAIDDLWQNPQGEYIVVDYKATSKLSAINLDADWQISYKRQMEIYQWLLRHQKLPVSNTGYFVYCNGKTDREGFDAKLEFELHLIPYTGNDSWVDGALLKAHACLNGELPPRTLDCEYCQYLEAAGAFDSIEA